MLIAGEQVARDSERAADPSECFKSHLRRDAQGHTSYHTKAHVAQKLDGDGWRTYDAPIRIGAEGLHTLRYRARDAQGNVEPERSLTVRIDKTDPLAAAIARPFLLWPVNRQLVDVDVSVVMKDVLSGSDGFKLVSVVSSDSAPPGDTVGWTMGTFHTRGQLRAARTAFGRIYVLTYEAVDRAGNTARAVALVLVPPGR